MLSEEDKADVKGAMGKAIANKVSKVTRDTPYGHGAKTSKSLSELGLEKSRSLSGKEKGELASYRAKSKALQGKKEHRIVTNSNADLIHTARQTMKKGNLPRMGQALLASMSRENKKNNPYENRY